MLHLLLEAHSSLPRPLARFQFILDLHNLDLCQINTISSPYVWIIDYGLFLLNKIWYISSKGGKSSNYKKEMHLPPALSAFSFCSQTSENFWASSGSPHFQIWTNCRSHRYCRSPSPRPHPVIWRCCQEGEENHKSPDLLTGYVFCDTLFTIVDWSCLDTNHRGLTLRSLHLHCPAAPPCSTSTQSWLRERGERWAGSQGDFWCDTENILTRLTLRKRPNITRFLPLRQRHSRETNVALVYWGKQKRQLGHNKDKSSLKRRMRVMVYVCFLMFNI